MSEVACWLPILPNDVLAWLAGALARCAPVLEWTAVRRTKDSEINARVSCTRLIPASDIEVKLAVERSVV